MFCLVSCSSEKEKLLTEYKTIVQLVRENQLNKLESHLDQPSVEFLNFVSDTANMEYHKMKSFGESKNLMLFTSVYQHRFGNIKKGPDKCKSMFFAYLIVDDFPVFSNSSESELLTKETKTGEENYVVVSSKMNETTYITSKINFSKDEEGRYKMNLLDVLKLNDKLLKQAFKKYSSSIKKLPESQQPSDMVLSFLENMDNPENQLTEFMYMSQ